LCISGLPGEGSWFNTPHWASLDIEQKSTGFLDYGTGFFKMPNFGGHG